MPCKTVGPTPVIDAMFSRDEPRTTASGTLAWAVDVDNPATGEAFTLTLKEITLQDMTGRRLRALRAGPFGQLSARAGRPRSPPVAGHAGARPGVDRHEVAQAPELRRAPRSFHGPGARERRQQVWPSTVAYIARLAIHRYAMLGGVLTKRLPAARDGLLERRPGDPEEHLADGWPAVSGMWQIRP